MIDHETIQYVIEVFKFPLGYCDVKRTVCKWLKPRLNEEGECMLTPQKWRKTQTDCPLDMKGDSLGEYRDCK